MAEEPRYDVIIVGAGMGGLSAGAFLAKEGKKVVVLEKHDKPGGYVTSFTRGGYTFDTSIAHVNELGENQTIQRFVRYWGGSVSSYRVQLKLKYFIDDKEYLIDTGDLPDSLVACFPSKKRALERFLSITERIMREAASSGPMKPSCDMTPLEKLMFIANGLIKQPTIVRYGMKPAVRVLRGLLDDRHLETIIWAFYPINSLSLLSETWGWEKMRRGEYYYPRGGMQAIPDAAVEAIRRHGGDVVLNTEVKRVIVKDRKAVGVECSNGDMLYSDIVISNSPIHHTLFSLCAHVPEMDGLRRMAARQKVFTGTMALYMGIDEGYDFRGVDYFFFLSGDTKDIAERDLTPETCPILMMVPPAKPAGQRDYSVIVGAIVPYEYVNNWGTPVKNLYLVGQWVFPGGGVPAVMGGGYFVAKRILKKDGIDLGAWMNEFFHQTTRT